MGFLELDPFGFSRMQTLSRIVSSIWPGNSSPHPDNSHVTFSLVNKASSLSIGIKYFPSIFLMREAHKRDLKSRVSSIWSASDSGPRSRSVRRLSPQSWTMLLSLDPMSTSRDSSSSSSLVPYFASLKIESFVSIVVEVEVILRVDRRLFWVPAESLPESWKYRSA